jgi:hypothetical protein
VATDDIGSINNFPRLTLEMYIKIIDLVKSIIEKKTKLQKFVYNGIDCLFPQK